MSPAKAARAVWHRLIDGARRYLSGLDPEKVGPFQTMYYVLFTLFVATLSVPTLPEQEAAQMMRPTLYGSWLFVNLVCPSLTLWGRRLTRHAAAQPAGVPNLASGAAWMQFTGDLGVWCSVDLWVAVLFQTDWWIYNLFVVYFMLMGVAGGAMFTARSCRRIIEIRKLNRRYAQAGIPA